MKARLSKINPTVAHHSVWVPESIKWFKEIMNANGNRFRMKVTNWGIPQQVRNYIYYRLVQKLYNTAFVLLVVKSN
jgi:hypothetical protein